MKQFLSARSYEPVILTLSLLKNYSAKIKSINGEKYFSSTASKKHYITKSTGDKPQNILTKLGTFFPNFKPITKVAVLGTNGGGIAAILAWYYMYEEKKQKKDETLLESSSSSEVAKDTKLAVRDTVTFITSINDIRSKVEQIITAPHLNNQEKICQLKEIEEKHYKLLVQQLAYSQTTEESMTLVIVLDGLGHLTTKLGELSGEVKYYTDAAIFYQYVLALINDTEGLQKFTQTLEDLKSNISDPYKKLNILQSKLVEAISGRLRDDLKEIRSQEDIDKISHKEVLIALRNKTKEQIEIIEKYKESKQSEEYVKYARQTFKEIASGMGGYLAEIYKESIELLGPSPEECKYAIIGFGSMALEQATPYSDLEFGIIIEKYTPEILDYFRRLTHLVHFKVIFLGETIIPTSKYSTDMSHLVPQGVNFDLGGKTPLGRIDKDKPYDLIGTIDHLIKYVRNKDDKGTHIDKALPYILENVCFVYGDEGLVTNYKEQVKLFLHEPYSCTTDEEERYQELKNHQARSLKILEEGAVEINYLQRQTEGLSTINFKGDLKKLTPVFGDENEGKLFDVKQEIYRLPDRMIYNLGMYFGIQGDSAWDTIDKLESKGIINFTGAKNLKDAVTFATMLRLKTYDHNKCQRDSMSTYEVTVYDRMSEKQKKQLQQQTFYIKNTEELHRYYYVMLRLVEIEEELCNGNSRERVIALLKIDNLYSDSDYNKGIVHARLLEYVRALEYMEKIRQEEPHDLNVLNELYYLYQKAGKIKKAVAISHGIVQLIKNKYEVNTNHHDIAYGYNNLAIAYEAYGQYEKAIEYHKKSLEISIIAHHQTPNHPNIARSYNGLGNTCKKQGKHDEAIRYYNKTLEISLKAHESNPNHPDIAGSYNNLGNVHEAQGEYVKAMEYYEKSLEIMLKVYESRPNHSHIAISYNNLATVHEAQGEYDKAIEYHKKSLEVMLKAYKGNLNHPDIAATYNGLGNAYNSKGQYNKAIEYYNKSLEIRLEVYEAIPNHPALAISYNNLGNAYKRQCKYDKAIEYHQKSLEIMLKAYKDDLNHPDIAGSYNNLGEVYKEQGQYDKAIQYYKKSLEVILKAYKGNLNHPKLAIIYNNLGAAYDSKGEYDKAIEYHKKSLEVVLKAHKNHPNHPNIAAIYNNLGAAYDSKGEYDKAIEYYEKSLEISLKAHKNNPNHPDIAAIYNGLGNVHEAQREYDKAIEYYKKSLEIMIKAYKGNLNHPNIAGSYNNLGEVYKEQGKYEKAIEYYEKSLEIRLKVYESNQNHPDIVGSYNNLRDVYREQGKYEKSIHYHKKSLEISLTAHHKTPNHLNIADIYNGSRNVHEAQVQDDTAIENYGAPLQLGIKAYEATLKHPYTTTTYSNIENRDDSSGQHEKTIEYLEEPLEVMLKARENNVNHPDIAGVYNDLGDACREQGKYHEAIEYHEKSLRISLKVHGNNANHPDIARSYNGLGNACFAQLEYDKAIEYYKKSLEIRLKAHENNPNHPDIATSYNCLGNACSVRLEYDEAIEYYKKSLEIRLKIHENNLSHPDIAAIYNNLGNNCLVQWQYDEAIEYYKKSLEISLKAYKSNPIHPDIADSYNNLGKACCGQELYDEAIENYKKSLDIRLKVYESNSNHPLIASSYNNLGDAYRGQRQYIKAIEYYEKSLEIFLTAYESNPSHPYIGVIYNNLGMAYKVQGQDDKACEYYEKASAINNPTGNGSKHHTETSYWYEYSRLAMEEILGFRLKSLGINIEDAKIIKSTYIFNETNPLRFVKDLVTQISAANLTTDDGISCSKPKLLIPINIDRKHWVGMIIKFVDRKINLTYMDSEGAPMPKSLSDGLKTELARSYPDATIEMVKKEVELQKYNNCGLEVIENLISAVAGEAARIDQEEALAVHSMLYEQSLILEEAWRAKALQEDKAKYEHEVRTKASEESTKLQETVDAIKVDKEAKGESSNVIAQASSVTAATDSVVSDSVSVSSGILTEETLKVDPNERYGKTLGVQPEQAKMLNTSSLNTVRQPAEVLADEVWDEIKNSNTEEIVDEELEAVYLAESEVESMSIAWNQVQDGQSVLQTIETTGGEENTKVGNVPIERFTEQPEDHLSGQQQPISQQPRQSDVQLEPIDIRYEAEKILMEESMKSEQQAVLAPQPQQYPIKMAAVTISPNEIASSFNFFMKWLTGESPCGGVIPTHNGVSLLSGTLDILQGVRLIPTDSMGRPIRDSRDFMEAIESEFKALNGSLTDQRVSPQLPSSSLFEGIELSDIGTPGWSWIQQSNDEVELSGKGE